MKTAQGKLALLAFCLLMAALLFLPMRAGQEDSLIFTPTALKMSVGDSYKISCALSSWTRASASTPGTAVWRRCKPTAPWLPWPPAGR